MVFGPPNGGKNFPPFLSHFMYVIRYIMCRAKTTFIVPPRRTYSREKNGNAYIGTNEAGNASGVTICLICKEPLSNDLEETIYETAAGLIAVDRNNINIVVEVNYSPDGDANSETEQDAADSDSVTYVY